MGLTGDEVRALLYAKNLQEFSKPTAKGAPVLWLECGHAERVALRGLIRNTERVAATYTGDDPLASRRRAEFAAELECYKALHAAMSAVADVPEFD